MISLRFLKSFPKFALVVAVLVISTAAFAYWWMFRTPAKRAEAKVEAIKEKEIIAQKVAIAEERIANLFLADGDLMDVMTGEVIFDNWLGGDVPSDIYYDSKSKTLIAGYPRGIVRYGLDGEKQGELAVKYPCGFTEGFRAVLFAKDKDVWWADVNVEKLQLQNERQITKSGLIHEPYFAQNIIVATEKTLVVNNLNQQIKIDMATGNMEPYRLPMENIQKRRSPDGKWLAGEQQNHFYVHEIDTQETKAVEVGRLGIKDFQWLDNERCLFVYQMEYLKLYDRKTGKVSDVVTLPTKCFVIANPSPSGRYVFCANHNQAFLVDLEDKKLEATPAGGSDFVWLDDNHYLFRRDVIETVARGTWRKSFGEPERRAAEEPFLVGRNGGPLLTMLKPLNMMVFATRQGLNRLNMDGKGLAEIVKLSEPPSYLQRIRDWP